MVVNRQEEKGRRPEKQATRFSADVQLEHGYVQTANDLLEALFIAGLSQRKRQIIDCIIRYSWGCNKRKCCHLTPPEIDDLTGIDKADVYDILHDLKRRCIVEWDLRTHKLSFQKDYGKWIVSEKVYRKLKRIGGGIYKEMVRKQLQGEVSVGKSPTKKPGVGKSPTESVGKLPKKVWANHLQVEAVDPQPKQISGASKASIKETCKKNGGNKVSTENKHRQLEDAFAKDTTTIILIKKYLKLFLKDQQQEQPYPENLISSLVDFKNNTMVEGEQLSWNAEAFEAALQRVVGLAQEGEIDLPFMNHKYLKKVYRTIITKGSKGRAWDPLFGKLKAGKGICPECEGQTEVNFFDSGTKVGLICLNEKCPYFLENQKVWKSKSVSRRDYERMMKNRYRQDSSYDIEAEFAIREREIERSRRKAREQ